MLEVFKDWVENNAGWKIMQNESQTTEEALVHKLILLGGKTYLNDHNLDMNCENNIDLFLFDH